MARQNRTYAKDHRADISKTYGFSNKELLAWKAHCEKGSPARSSPRPPKLSFSDMDSAGAATYLRSQQGYQSIAIMNFANGSKPGGGYLHGSRAQEEALCRQWPLYHPSLQDADRRDRLYPFGAYSPEVVDNVVSSSGGRRRSTRMEPAQAREVYNRVLVTPGVSLMRDGPNTGFCALEPEEQFPVTMVAAVAPRAMWRRGRQLPEGLKDTIVNTILAPLIDWRKQQELQGSSPPSAPGSGSGAASSRRVLVLGAWGCGAFGNDPSQMAVEFANALHEVFCSGAYASLLSWAAGERHASYDEVHFAMPAFRHKANAEQFKRVIGLLAAGTLEQELIIYPEPPPETRC